MTAIRLGEISFINALPLSLPLQELAGVALEKLVRPPTTLNQAMLAGQLDVSPVSSAFYLRHQSRFTLLDGISISAEHPVESVLLFLPGGFDGLTPETPIAVPDASETSIALMQYVVYRQAGFVPRNLLVYPLGQASGLLEQSMPLLAMGDEALTLKDRFQLRHRTVDLADAWQAEMQLPFVFAVWVAQNQWAEENPELFALLNRLLVSQKATFLTDSAYRDGIIEAARQKRPRLPKSLIARYFTHALSYNLDMAHRTALCRFEEILKWLDDDTAQDPTRHRTLLSVQLLHR